MSQVLFQVVSATNYAQKISNIFHKTSRSIVGWQSTQYAVPPISILFKLNFLAFVTELYIHPKINKFVKQMEIMISDDNSLYQSVAKIYDFNQGVRIQISAKCKYLKFNVLEKQYGKPASLDFLRVYGHQYFKNAQKSVLFSQKKDKIEEILLQNGMMEDKKWEVDSQTLITLSDMSRLRQKYKVQGQHQNLNVILKDFNKVLSIGKKIHSLQNQIKWLHARQDYTKIKDLKDQIMTLSKQRDHYDQKYQTSRFQDMIMMDDNNNRQQEILKSLLEEDKKKLEQEKRRRQEQALRKQQEIDDQYKKLEQQEQWYNKKNEKLEQLQPVEEKPIPKKKKQAKKQPKIQSDQQNDLEKGKYQFNNPYVYNQGDADMEKYIKPLIGQFGASYLGDPELLRKYQQLQYLDILGARIWISTHSQNWRQRAAAVQAVLDFGQSELPERYKTGKTRNLFLALMQFARINAEDKVLQIYYTSLKIMTIALAPPICGDDVPVALINKSLQKVMPTLIQKISQTNARAKQVSLKTLISIFKHPAADINIAIQQCLKLCKQELNIKFIPVDKQNPRLIQSRLEIISKILTDIPKIQKKKVDYDQILRYLIEGGLFHSHNDVRVMSVDVVQKIYKLYTEGTVKWFKGLNGLKPNISAEIQARLKIF